MSELNPLKKLYRFLFDFSAGQTNQREAEDILIAALAQSQTDDDFHYALRRVVFAYEGSKARGEDRFFAFNRFIYGHRRLSDRDAGIRTQAEHLLEDLPRIYGSKSVKPAPSAPAQAASSRAAAANTKENNADV